MTHTQRMNMLLLAMPLMAGMTLVAHTTQAQQPSDTVPPTITIGLANSNNFLSVLPLPSNLIVTPDARGRVIFRAEISDAGVGVRNASITVPNASGSLFTAPSPRGYLGTSWDTRRVANGATAQIRVVAFDARSNRAEQIITVTLQK